MELRLLWISTILLGQVVCAFAWTHSGITRTTPCSSTSRLVVLWEHVGASSQTYHPPHYADGVKEDNAVTDTDDANARVEVETTPVSTAAAVTRNRASWMDRVQQLQEYCAAHGNTLVPKRYKANPALGNWVNKQRQSYRKYLRDEQPCSLTSQQVDILNSIGFCWDASNVTSTTAATMATRERTTASGESIGDDDDAWWIRLKELERYVASLHIDNGKSNNVTCLANSSPPTHMRAWIREQQRDYQMNLLREIQSEALSAIDPDWWKSQRQVQWDVRYKQLQVYKQEHGDCCVPISYANKQLANWVHNQRKQYNLRLVSKASDLTTERLERLQDIGFVWNRWEYEFDKKAVQMETASAVNWNTR
jgi:hypothetical protein